jgi:hypothetical protein
MYDSDISTQYPFGSKYARAVPSKRRLCERSEASALYLKQSLWIASPAARKDDLPRFGAVLLKTADASINVSFKLDFGQNCMHFFACSLSKVQIFNSRP